MAHMRYDADDWTAGGVEWSYRGMLPSLKLTSPSNPIPQSTKSKQCGALGGNGNDKGIACQPWGILWSFPMLSLLHLYGFRA